MGESSLKVNAHYNRLDLVPCGASSSKPWTALTEKHCQTESRILIVSLYVFKEIVTP